MTPRPVPSCPGSEVLGAMAESRLTAAERARVIAHLDGCASCRAEVAMLAEFANETAAPVQRAPARWWLVAAAILVAGASALLVTQRDWTGGGVAPLVAAAEPLRYRLTEARLTGGFGWAEFRGPVRSTDAARDPLRLKVSGAAGDVLQRAERDRDAQTQHAAGVAALLIEDRGEAIERLSRVTAERPDHARAWNDLAAARHEAAMHFGRASELPLALAAVDRTLKLEPRMPEALFNRALIVERLGLIDEAREAWRQYLDVDGTSEWAAEARQRLEGLPKTSSQASRRARPYAEVELLGDWGTATLAGAGADAAQRLAEARATAAALAARGERLLSDAVAAIDSAPAEDRQRLATAHVAYRAARQALGRREAETAQRELRRVAALFGDRSPAGALLARYYAASAAYVAGRIDETERELLALRADPHLKPSYKALRAQIAWQYGLTQARLARWSAAVTEYRDAQALFSELDEDEAAFLDALVAEAAIFLGRRDEAWERWCRAMRTLSIRDFDNKLAVTLGTAGRTEWLAGRGEVARSLLEIEIRQGPSSGAVRADALLRRTILSARMNDRDEAAGALREAERAIASIPDADARAAMAADLRVAEGIAFAEADPPRALLALTGAIEDYRKRRPLLLPVALFERGRVLRAMGRTGEAADDLRASAAALEEQREEIEWRDVRSGALDGAAQIYTTLAELLLERGANGEAFAVADRAAAHAFYGSAGAPSRLPVAELQRRLAPGDVLVEYLLLPRELVVFVLDARRLEVRRIPATPSLLVERAAALDAAMRDRAAAEAVRQASSALHELLVAPLRDDLTGAAAITFVPPPAIAATPFAALFDARSGRWLIEDYTVRVAPSVVRGRGTPPAPRAARVVIVQPSAGAAPLPDAAAEAAALMRLYPGAMLIEGRDASAANVLAAIAPAGVIHYAGHADSQRETGLVLRSEGERDELLYGADIARAPLRGAPLVVLAGCRTLRGGMRSDQLSAGLARAFLLAGAREVIGTAWDIKDGAAAELFGRLHGGLAASADPAAALRSAQLGILRQPSRHAADWAAAQLVVRSAAGI